jgi:hypothetical protein
VLHSVGDREDIIAQLAIGDAAFWIAATGPSTQPLVPRALGGTTGRLLLMIGDQCSEQSRSSIQVERCILTTARGRCNTI